MARPKTTKKNTNFQERVPASAAPAVPETVEGPVMTEVKKAKTARVSSKPELVRTDSRTNLIPISLDEEIRRRAYLLSESRGFEPGHEAEDWLNAERELVDQYPEHRA